MAAIPLKHGTVGACGLAPLKNFCLSSPSGWLTALAEILDILKTARFKYLYICTNMQMNKLEERSRLYRALGEPVRLRIVEYLLRKGRCTCVCELSRLLKRDQSVIFRHIQVLRDAGILNTSKQAKYLICCVKESDRIRRLMEV